MPISSAKAARWPSLLDIGQDTQSSLREGVRACPRQLTVRPLSLRGNQPGDSRDERRGGKEGKSGPSKDKFSVGVGRGCHLSGTGTPAEGVWALIPPRNQQVS